MTIEEIGSIGELVAAIATVLTLAYLAVQIRQNTRGLEDARARAFFEDAGRWRDKLIMSAEVAALYRRGITGTEALDADERLRFRMLMDDLFYQWQYDYQANATHGHVAFLAPTLATPGGQAYWEKSKHRFSENFIRHVDRVREAAQEN